MKRLLFLSFLFLGQASVRAQWNTNSAQNNAIATTSPTTTKNGLVAVPDGSGGMFLAWSDSRISSNQTVYVQRILANGTLGFPSEVAVADVANAAGATKTNITMVSDGAGGVILAWQDQRNRTAPPNPVNNNDEIYGNRVSSTGSVLWGTQGVRLTVSTNATSSKTIPSISLVNATEAIVVFGDNRNGTVDLFAQKVAISNGATQWAGDVSLHGAQTGTQTSVTTLEDGAGGVFAIWQDPRGGTTTADIYTQRINNDGTMAWNSAGVEIANNTFNNLQPQFVSDGAGGFVATWSDQRNGNTNADIYAQRIGPLGTAVWPTANGILICNAVLNQTNPVIIKSGSNFIIGWSDQRVATNDRNVYVNSIDINGSLPWLSAGTSGQLIVDATGNQPQSANTMSMVEDGSGGAILVWDDARGADVNIYTRRVDNTGTVLGPANGVLVSSAAGNQNGPVAVPTTDGGVIAAWRDGRNGTASGEIYAARLQSFNILPVNFVQVSAYLLQETAVVKWTTADEIDTEKFVVEKSVDGNRFTVLGWIKAQGTGGREYQLSDATPVQGRNFYRIRSVDVDGKQQYSSIVSVVLNRRGKAFGRLYPQPVQGAATFQIGNFEKGQYSLRLTASSGAPVLARRLVVTDALLTGSIDLSSLAAAVYFLEVRDTGGKLVYSQTLVKK